MSEAIAEMVLPGTYIEVRSEGLISVGSIATGNIGIVGTGRQGPARARSSRSAGSAEAIDVFGPPDSCQRPAHDGGPAARRSSGRCNRCSPAAAATSTPSASPAARRPRPRSPCAASTGNAFLSRRPRPARGATRSGSSWSTTAPGDHARFRLTVSYRNQREVFEGGNVGQLRTALADVRRSSTVADPPGHAGRRQRPTSPPSTSALTGGNSVPNVNATHVTDGLALLEDQPVNIVLVAGLGADVAGAPLLRPRRAHRERRQGADRRRRRRRPATPATVLDDAGGLADDRVILVAPGSSSPSRASTDARGAAARRPRRRWSPAGSPSLAPHISLTNQTLPIAALDVNYSTTGAPATCCSTG